MANYGDGVVYSVKILIKTSLFLSSTLKRMIFPESEGDSGLCWVWAVNIEIFLNFISRTETFPEAGGVLARAGPDNPQAKCDYKSW